MKSNWKKWGSLLIKYDENKAAYQDNSWFERERNVLDVRNWNRDLMGQTFYQTCHDNKNKYRTIQFKWNPFVESLKPMISDPITYHFYSSQNLSLIHI